MRRLWATLGVTRPGWRWFLTALSLLAACDAHALTKEQASSLLLTYLQQRCVHDWQEASTADPGRYQRFINFYRTVILANPARFPRQHAASRAPKLGLTFGETDERIPLSLKVERRGPTISIEYCPWYTTEVQIFGLVQVDPDTQRVTYGQTKTLSRLTTDLSAAGIPGATPPANAQMRLALFKRDGNGTWTVDPSS